MRDKEIKESLADMAGMAERDHEVQMARADLYKIAKYAIKLHDMMKQVTEADGIEGWQQAKITKAADYMDSVYHSLDYDIQFNQGDEEAPAVDMNYESQMGEALNKKLASKLSESTQTCNECGKTMLTASEKKELSDLKEGKRHGNSNIYKKCWKGCTKVAGKKRGEPGSCKCD
jgi:hypothetical protein|tara:strand:- start:1196 stop:1717 length:522 start_codon:yes stop_codon:yes gene_type:complete